MVVVVVWRWVGVLVLVWRWWLCSCTLQVVVGGCAGCRCALFSFDPSRPYRPPYRVEGRLDVTKGGEMDM